MIKKILMIFAAAISLSFQNPVHAASISGDVRGVTFFYLDGVGQDFPWVLANQYNPTVKTRIQNVLAAYNAAGINWIRLLVAANHFTAPTGSPPSATLIKQVNDFMALTRAAGPFKIELVLIPEQVKTQYGMLFTDTSSGTYDYDRDKAWFKAWLSNLNFTNLGMVMFGGDLSPCYLSGCEDEAGAEPLPRNHGPWIRSIWKWKQQYYPTLNAAYEVVGIQDASQNSPNLIKKLVRWSNTHTPTVPIMAASLYIDLPSGSSWQSYANATLAVLDAYHSVSSKPLWIDEYGKAFGTNWTAQDQRNAYQGFLGASVCWRQNRYAKFAWVAGNDFPYINNNWFGLISGFDASNQPKMTGAWQDLSLYYKLQSCP